MDQTLYIIIAAAVLIAVAFLLITISGKSLGDFWDSNQDIKNQSNDSFMFDISFIGLENRLEITSDLHEEYERNSSNRYMTAI